MIAHTVFSLLFFLPRLFAWPYPLRFLPGCFVRPVLGLGDSSKAPLLASRVKAFSLLDYTTTTSTMTTKIYQFTKQSLLWIKLVIGTR